jgi:hypothetical protein
MASNLDRYKNDLDSLSRKGKVLRLVMETECFPERFKTPEWEEKLKALPSFKSLSVLVFGGAGGGQAASA